MNNADIIKWAGILGVSKEEIIARRSGNHVTEPISEIPNESNYLLDHLTNLEEQFKRLLNQLDVKDRQIEKLMDLLGKLEPATEMSKVKDMWPKKQVFA